MAGFSETAAYFESKAKKARAAYDQQRFGDAATFYRTLAQITPSLPAGYTSRQVEPNGSPAADRLRARAEECRAIAEVTRDPTCRAKLIRLADSYEAMAAGVK